MTTNFDRVADAIAVLTLKEAHEWGDKLTSMVKAKQDCWYGSPEYLAERQQMINSNEKRRISAAARDANRATWAAANLSAGMIVKMAGTRDGVGVRYVVALQDGQVVCRKCAPVWRNDIESFRRSYPSNEVFMLKTKTREVVNNWYVEHDVTTHAMEKVAGLFVKNDKGVYTLQGID